MSNRVYLKNDYLYSTDQKGELCQTYTKEVTIPVEVAAGANAAIQLLKPNGTTKVKTFMAKILLAAGSEYISVADHPTTYVLANNVLTVSVPADGAVIPVGAKVTILYTVGA